MMYAWEPDLSAPDPSAPSLSPSLPILTVGSCFQGRLSGTPKGIAFITAPDGGPDLFIPPSNRGGAQHGELVQVELSKIRHDGRREGEVRAVLSATPSWSGTVQERAGHLVLEPRDGRFPWVALETPAAIGEWAVVELAARGPWQSEETLISALATSSDSLLRAHVVEALPSRYTSRNVSRIHAALAGFQEHSATTCEQAQLLSSRPQDQDPWQYEDLRHLPFMTIDGESTKDFDDALYAEPLSNGGYRLWVAIADVAAYVAHGSEMDEQARQRATSVYLPGLVFPMLPGALSEGACSLNPGVDRAALVLCLDFNAVGESTLSHFVAAKIHSHARLTYTGATNWLTSQGKHGPALSGGVAAGLRALGGLTEILLGARQRRGALDFDRSEYRLAFTSDGEVRGVFKPARTLAHRLVEECMVAANVAAAQFLRQRGLPLLSRHHPSPTPQRLAALLAHYPEADTSTPGALAKILVERPDLSPFVRMASGSAEYSPHHSGHFGLALEEYAHFTSPIRRYPDILVHRAIHVALGNLPATVLDEHWVTLGIMSTERERAAAAAERAATDQLRIEWLSRELTSNLDATHQATIEGATPAGVFLALEACGASGLLRAPVGSEYFPALKSWKHADGSSWILGQSLEVVIASVDVPAGRIAFSLPATPALARSVSP